MTTEFWAQTESLPNGVLAMYDKLAGDKVIFLDEEGVTDAGSRERFIVPLFDKIPEDRLNTFRDQAKDQRLRIIRCKSGDGKLGFWASSRDILREGWRTPPKTK